MSLNFSPRPDQSKEWKDEQTNFFFQKNKELSELYWPLSETLSLSISLSLSLYFGVSLSLLLGLLHLLGSLIFNRRDFFSFIFLLHFHFFRWLVSWAIFRFVFFLGAT